MKYIIIQASARSEGNTHKIVQALCKHIKCDVIDLKTKKIAPYSYEQENKTDDFLPLMQSIIAEYDVLLFATPVYWYAMSGLLKTFMDRLTDCVTTEKSIGRSLKGKKIASLSCGSDAEEVVGFHAPFELSAAYLDMEYIGAVHTWIAQEDIEVEVLDRVEKFAKKIKK